MKLEVKINAESRTFYTEVTHFDTVCQTPVDIHLHLRPQDLKCFSTNCVILT